MTHIPLTKEKAKTRLMSLCARSEQCEYDILQKMFRWGLSEQDREEVIDFLKENRYIDNGRYASGFAMDKARFSHWGPIKIKMELLKKRIPAEMIKAALSSVDKEVWKEGLKKNLFSKSRHLNLLGEEGYENGNKLLRYLVSRGFPMSSCIKAVGYMKKLQEKEKEDLNED